MRLFLAVTRVLARLDQRVIDGAVNGAGALGRMIGDLKRWADQVLIDGSVNGLARLIRRTGAGLRRAQTGIIQQYLLVVVLAVVVVSIALRR